jgi:hypothetical protein
MVTSPATVGDPLELDEPFAHTTTSGASTVFPGVVPPLTWTCAGPAFEFSLRSGLCGLGLVPWPAVRQEWYVAGRIGGLARIDADLIVRALVTGRTQAAQRRARRVLSDTSQLAGSETRQVGALRDGRVHSSLVDRSDSDLVMTLGRLHEWAFAISADHGMATAAMLVTSGETDPDTAAAAFGETGPTPLWGVDAAASAGRDREAQASGEDPRRALSGALRVALEEVRLLADELGRRAVEHGRLGSADDLVLLRWEELPDLPLGRLPGDLESRRQALADWALSATTS